MNQSFFPILLIYKKIKVYYKKVYQKKSKDIRVLYQYNKLIAKKFLEMYNKLILL